MKIKELLVSLSLFCVATIGANAQKNMNDTILDGKYVRSSWAINYGMGVVVPHQPQNFTASTVGLSIHFSVLFKNFMFFENMSMYSLSAKSNYAIDNQFLNKSSAISVGQMSIGFGYCYDFHKNWAIQGLIGKTGDVFTVTNRATNNSTYTHTSSSDGTVFGLGFSRYIHLRRFNYLVITANYNYHSTNNQDVCTSFDNKYSDVTFTLCYKGWFRKKLK